MFLRLIVTPNKISKTKKISIFTKRNVILYFKEKDFTVSNKILELNLVFLILKKKITFLFIFSI